MKLPVIAAPKYSRAAWARHLRRQGASHAEIAKALNLDVLTAARLAGRQCPSQPDSAAEASEGRSP